LLRAYILVDQSTAENHPESAQAQACMSVRHAGHASLLMSAQGKFIRIPSQAQACKGVRLYWLQLTGTFVENFSRILHRPARCRSVSLYWLRLGGNSIQNSAQAQACMSVRPAGHASGNQNSLEFLQMRKPAWAIASIGFGLREALESA
jgi:hypothetical protein